MRPEKVDRNKEILKRVEEGETIKEIAKEFGISRQAVNNIMHKYNVKRVTDGRVLKGIDAVVYPKIKEYLFSNQMAVSEFCYRVGNTPRASGAFYRFLRGERQETSIDSIQNMLKVMGTTFEEVFPTEYCTSEPNHV